MSLPGIKPANIAFSTGRLDRLATGTSLKLPDHTGQILGTWYKYIEPKPSQK